MLGLITALFQPSGCLIPDYCIVLEVEGSDACTTAENAMMWPINSPEDVQRVLEDGGAPVGCECMNAIEAQWIEDEAPQDQYLGFLKKIHDATRNECAAQVPPGFDHNCYTDEITFGVVFVNSGPTRSGSCLHSCPYFHPPPNGTCPDDPNPFECNDDGDIPTATGTETDTGMGTDETTGGELL